MILRFPPFAKFVDCSAWQNSQQTSVRAISSNWVPCRAFNQPRHAFISNATRYHATFKSNRSSVRNPPFFPQGKSEPSTGSAESQLTSWRRNVSLTIGILQLVFIGHLFTTYIGTISRTGGPSMVPTLSVENDWILVSKLHKRGKGVKVGDLVTFIHPMDPETGALKRVIGMPGDFVLSGQSATNMEEKMMIQVPEGHCWLLGDNLPYSRDSRFYGPLPLALIDGKAIAKVLPLGEIGWLKNTLEPPAEEAEVGSI